MMDDAINLICNYCDCCINSKKKLIHHIKTIHINVANEDEDEEKKESFNCSKCYMVFSYKGNLVRHIKNVHGNESGKSESWNCEICGLIYSYRANMLRHIKMQHPNSAIPKKIFKHVCTLCPRRFNHVYNFKCHMRKVHGIELPERLRHKCPLCTELIPGKMKLVLNHLNDKHGITVVKKEVQFSSVKKFHNWKERIEKETNCCFIRFARRGDSRDEYRCHRSGIFISKSQGIRKLKTQGSKKMDSICPASITLYKKDKCTYRAVFIETHVGHENDIKYLFLSEKDRLSIACKIACNIPFDTILNDLRKSASHSKLERKHLISKKDLYNIQSSYGLGNKRNENDLSIDWWIVETASTDNSCIIFYKTQGLLRNSQDNNKDFILILMNDLQCELLVNYSKNIVCLDRTQCLNKHGLELISIYVVNETKTIPCVFIVTNKIERNDLIYYFKLLKEQVGILKPEIVLTDVEPILYESWCEAMGTPRTRLYSSWHVDWAIRKNLFKIKSKDKQSFVYHAVLNIIEEKNSQSFKTKLDLFLNSLQNDQDTLEFFQYFKLQFVDLNFAWSDFQREQSGLKNETDLEHIHKAIKYMYLNKDNVEHVNKSLSDIMKYIRDRLIYTFVTYEDHDFKMKEILDRHDKALLQFSGARIMEHENTWKVDFPAVPNCEIFTVNQVFDQCDCSLICPSCSVCLHKYSCSCTDSCLKWNMCLHIHLVCTYFNTTKNNRLLGDAILFYDYINVDRHCTISLNGNVQNIEDISPTLNVLSTLNTDDVEASVDNGLSINHIVDSLSSSVVHSLSSADMNSQSNLNNTLPSNIVQNTVNRASYTRNNAGLICCSEIDDHLTNSETLIATLDQRRTALTQKILNILQYVENVESVEMVDAVEKLLVPIESTLVSIKPH